MVYICTVLFPLLFFLIGSSNETFGFIIKPFFNFVSIVLSFIIIIIILEQWRRSGGLHQSVN